MSTEDNKAIVRRFYAAADKSSTGQDISAEVGELLAPNARHHLPGATELDNAAFLQFVQPFALGFPHYHHEIEDQIAEGDKVATIYTWSGTHRGDFQGIPPTGKQATISAMSTDRIVGGQIVEHRGVFDALGLMQQLGVIPSMG